MVVRFFITQRKGTAWLRKPYPKPDAPWYVVDATTWRQAHGTSYEGYNSEVEARKVARKYRDEFGAYCKSPF